MATDLSKKLTEMGGLLIYGSVAHISLHSDRFLS
jgi:hypothetical protein